MKSYFILLATSLFSVRAELCSVCGEDKWVTKPDELFVFEGQPTVPCGLFEQIAIQQDVVPNGVCSELAGLEALKVCGCAKKSEGCSICGEDAKVYETDAIFTNPDDQSNLACGEVERRAKAGEQDCSSLPADITEICGCGPIGTISYEVTGAPVPVAAPTSLGAGAIIGIMAGIVVAGGILIALVVFVAEKRKKKRAEAKVVSPPPIAFSAATKNNNENEIL